jgi:predicted nucleic acid-binding Zn ribbon protein
MINASTKTCLQCGASLQGRVDKKFCSDQCRSGFNNSIKANNRDYIRRVNYILKKNLRILTQLQSEGYTQIPADSLRFKGFDFNYFTSYQPSPEGVNFYCYDQGIVRDENQTDVRLIKRNV